MSGEACDVPPLCCRLWSGAPPAPSWRAGRGWIPSCATAWQTAPLKPRSSCRGTSPVLLHIAGWQRHCREDMYIAEFSPAGGSAKTCGAAAAAAAAIRLLAGSPPSTPTAQRCWPRWALPCSSCCTWTRRRRGASRPRWLNCRATAWSSLSSVPPRGWRMLRPPSWVGTGPRRCTQLRPRCTASQVG